MRIHSLRLVDFKRFADFAIDLGPGINVIRGGNGSGKTTLLEAVAFALFGGPLERAGEATGEAAPAQVELGFTDGGDRLRLLRTSPATPGAAADSDATLSGSDGRDIAHGEAAVRASLAARLDTTEDARLGALATWLGTDPDRPFRLDRAARRAYFAPLLDLGRGDRLARRTLELGLPFQAEAQRLQVEAARGEGTLKGYRETEARLTIIAAEAAAATVRLAAARERLDRLRAEVEAEASRRSEAEELRREQAVLAETVRLKSAEEQRLRAALAEAEEASRMLDRAQAAHSRWELLEAECRVLELQRHGHEQVRVEVERVERELSSERLTTEAERERIRLRLEENQKESEAILLERDALRLRLEAARAVSRRHEGGRTALTLALERTRRLVDLLAAVEPAATAEKPDAEAIRREEHARRATEAVASAQREAREAELAALRARAATEDGALTAARDAREAADRVKGELAQIEEHLIALRPALGACPFLAAPCSNIGGRSLVEHFDAQAGRLELGKASSQEALRFAEARVEEARAALRQLGQHLAAAPSATADPDDDRRGRRQPAETLRSRRPRPVPAGVPFAEIGHHLSALSGVLGAIEPALGDEPTRPRALLGAVAGTGSAEPTASATSWGPSRLDLPDMEAIDHGRNLAHQAEAALRGPAGGERDAYLADLARELARIVRRIDAATTTAAAQVERLLVNNRAAARAGEERLLDTSKALEGLPLERARIRVATKELSSRDLTILDLELRLSERRMKRGGHERIEREIGAKRGEQAQLLRDRDAYRAHAVLADRLETQRDECKRVEQERREAAYRLAGIEDRLHPLGDGGESDRLAALAGEREALHAEIGELQAGERSLGRERQFLAERLAEMEEGRRRLLALTAERDRAEQAQSLLAKVAAIYRAMDEPVATAAREVVELEASRMLRRVAPRTAVAWDQHFGLSQVENGGHRAFSELARGEQATMALAVHLALARQLPRLGLVLLDEPTAHLDPDHRQGLARVLQELRRATRGVVEQILVTAHDDTFDAIADRVVVLAAPQAP